MLEFIVLLIYILLYRSLREQIPVWLQPFTQMHGWWHIFAGYGVYIQVLFW